MGLRHGCGIAHTGRSLWGLRPRKFVGSTLSCRCVVCGKLRVCPHHLPHKLPRVGMGYSLAVSRCPPNRLPAIADRLESKSTDSRETGTIRAFNIHDVVVCVEQGHESAASRRVAGTAASGPWRIVVVCRQVDTRCSYRTPCFLQSPINGGYRLRYKPAGGRARNRTYRRNHRHRRSCRRRIPHPSSRRGRRPENDSRLACTRPTV